MLRIDFNILIIYKMMFNAELIFDKILWDLISKELL